MKGNEKNGERIYRVRDLVARHSRRRLPIVRLDDTVQEVIRLLEYYRHSRRLYAVDEAGRLKGCITLHDLVEHVFHHHHWNSIHPRGLLGVITTEKAEDLMIRETIHAGMEDELEGVVERMIERKVEEVPVLGESGRVIADLTLIDLMKVLG